MNKILLKLNINKKINWIKLDNLVKDSLKEDKSGHDYAHSQRVMKIALNLAKYYDNIDYDILVASCFLHDISYRNGFIKDHNLVSAGYAPEFLKKISFPEEKIAEVQIVIEDHVGIMVKSIRKNSELRIESKILRDADNIDALGSIGLIRMISFCAYKQFPYFTSKKAGFNDSVYSGIKALTSWPEKMLTPEGKKLARDRLKIMFDFLNEMEKEI